MEVEHEDTEALKQWGIGLEKIQEVCVFCRQPTRYWNRKTNQPVCQQCAEAPCLAANPPRKG